MTRQKHMRHRGDDWALLPWGKNVTVTRFLGPRMGTVSQPRAEMLRIETDFLYSDEALARSSLGSAEKDADLLPLILNRKTNWGSPDRGTEEPHLRFAASDTDEKLIQFVTAYGPVLTTGCHEEDSERNADGERAFAIEDFAALRAERQRFSSLLRLIARLKEPTFRRDAVLEVVEEVIRDYGSDDPSYSPIYLTPIGRQKGFSDPGIESLILQDLLHFLVPFRFAHQIVFSGPKARPKVQVLPDRAGLGFRRILYGLLLREMESEALPVRICHNKNCGATFQPERLNQSYCNRLCSAREAARTYYERTGKHRRADARSVVRRPRQSRSASRRET